MSDQKRDFLMEVMEETVTNWRETTWNTHKIMCRTETQQKQSAAAKVESKNW